jgi:hypothetical protein
MSTETTGFPVARGALPFYDDPPMVQATYAGQPCGCQIVGNGTLQHPLDVKRCPTHETAPKMYEALRALTLNMRHRTVECETGKAPRCVCGLDAALAALAAADDREGT